jgi:hypothetical protein
LRTLNTAEITYSSTFNSGFSQTLGYLGGPDSTGATTSTAAGLIDSVLSGTQSSVYSNNYSTKSGYSFVYSPAATDSSGHINFYQFTASPSSTSTGTNYYFTDQSGVIRQNSTTTAQSTDSPIAG